MLVRCLGAARLEAAAGLVVILLLLILEDR